MSQLATQPRPAQSMPAGRRDNAPTLHLVTARVESASSAAFVAFCLALLGAGLIAVLLLNTSLATGAFELRDLQRQEVVLDDATLTLERSINQASSPTALAERAVELGMVPAQDAAFLSVSDGKILGKPAPAVETENFSVVTSLRPPAAASDSTSAGSEARQ